MIEKTRLIKRNFPDCQVRNISDSWERPHLWDSSEHIRPVCTNCDMAVSELTLC